MGTLPCWIRISMTSSEVTELSLAYAEHGAEIETAAIESGASAATQREVKLRDGFAAITFPPWQPKGRKQRLRPSFNDDDTSASDIAEFARARVR
jgi:hypothetical protein